MTSLRRARTKSAELGLDLGSTHTRLVLRGRGEPYEVASTIALQASDAGRQVAAVGAEAKRMAGRASGQLRIVQPVRGGVIADYEATGHLLKHLLDQVPPHRPWGPAMVIAVPFDATEAERRALQESTRAAGVREAYLLDATLAAALGAQLPVLEARGSMVVSVGGGLSEVAVLSLGAAVVRRTTKVAGEDLDRRIGQWLRRHHQIMVGEPTAERIKLDVGAAQRGGPAQAVRIRGRDLGTGAPKTVDVSTDDVATAVEGAVTHLRDLVLEVLAATPPELCADILASGVILTGGASQLRGLDRVLSEATGLPVLRSELAGRSVARGLSMVVDQPELLHRLLST